MFDTEKGDAGQVEDSILPGKIDIQIEHKPSKAAIGLFAVLNAAAGGPKAFSLERQEIALDDLSVPGMGVKKRDRIRQYLVELTGCHIEHHDPKRKKTAFGFLLDWAEIDAGREVVMWRMGEAWTGLLATCGWWKAWGALDLEMVKAARNIHAQRLYQEIFMHHVKESVREMDLTPKELRHTLKVPVGKLTSSTDLIRRALNPAVKAVNEHTRYQVSYEAKRGKMEKLLGVKIKWEETDALSP